jgi:hypothetical protein
MDISRRLFLQSTSLAAAVACAPAFAVIAAARPLSAPGAVGFCLPSGNSGGRAITCARQPGDIGTTISAGTRVSCTVQAVIPGHSTERLPSSVAVTQRFCPVGCADIDVLMWAYRRSPVESGTGIASMTSVVSRSGLLFTLEIGSGGDSGPDDGPWRTTHTVHLMRGSTGDKIALREGIYLLPLASHDSQYTQWSSLSLQGHAGQLVVSPHSEPDRTVDASYIAISVSIDSPQVQEIMYV